MRIPRIFHPDLLAVDQEISLSPDAINHIGNVLRLRSGQPVVLFNGDGNEYPATLIEVGKRHVSAMIDAKLSVSCESPLGIHLGQAVSKGDRMDFVLQKSVELGVTDITPLTSERSVVKLSEERWTKKHEQWQKIIAGACEQCGRNRLPTLHPVMSLSQWTQQSTQQLRLTLDPRAELKMDQLHPPKEGIRLLIGPEGGLSDQEVYQAQQHGFIGIQLGPRVLRTETAALTAIAALQSRFGDL
ncbi:16S rRNA (uracil(1498)-N(3))-methyltransferase [Aliiglaciecola sp. CAU 1673]|uniref:16S rRNA (uracil(1498)-N(3))-methyltransferase n=1 Tax=Aliiglaciecola sp. CAU 1673 TaxID=3032595 RepID=UPI0023DB4252|nr:16S rRNA (uracil(1498)-N(3))-methyltransferase [Aliiglaciecola sp. CAU 1673]MDF2179482.1 16S rRNA (uracil(1498)-N(3))-methyltransferase [Aliiglaciecola sp. CAU 1673]